MYNSAMIKLTRRSFVSTLSAATVVPLSTLTARPRQPRYAHEPTAIAYRFFAPAEARFVEAACERLIPENSSGAGAGGAGVAHYLDQQLNSPWGLGKTPFRESAWQPGTALCIPPPFTPATLFRRALHAIMSSLDQRAAPFASLSADSQDQFLKHLESGGIDLRGAPPDVFFDMLLRMTVEGFFTDPHHGPTRDRIPWRVRGFPGAYAATSAQLQRQPDSKDHHAVALTD
jgi:gluconate 2-dehydrogenase gamma chain